MVFRGRLAHQSRILVHFANVLYTHPTHTAMQVLQVLRDRSVPYLANRPKCMPLMLLPQPILIFLIEGMFDSASNLELRFEALKMFREFVVTYIVSRSFLPLRLLNFFLHRLAGFFPESLLLVCGMGNKTLAHFFPRRCHHPAEVMRVRFQSAGNLAGKLHEG